VHRTVWSESRQAYVVAHEKTSAQGKASSTRLGVGNAVAAALLGLASSGAMAAGGNVCNPAEYPMTNSTYTGSGPYTFAVSGGAVTAGFSCNFIGSGDSLTVAGSGSISTTGSSNYAVYAASKSVASIQNSGLISADDDNVRIINSTVAGVISNSGTIQSLGTGGDDIYMGASTIQGGVTNSGTLSAIHHGIHLAGGQIVGAIHNTANGVIRTSDTAIYVANAGAHITGSIINQGVIQATGASSGYGVYMAGGTTVSGGLTNSGMIIGATYAVQSLATTTLPTVLNQAGGLIDGLVSIASNTTVTNAGTIAMPASTTSSIAGTYTQDSTGTLRTRATSPSAFGKLTVSGSATLPAGAKFNVVTGNAATCGGITVGTTLAGVISASSLSSSTFTATDDCTNVDFTAVKNGNAIDLVVIAAVAPTPASIPTLSEWGLIMLSSLLGLLTFGTLRRKKAKSD
jgi:hypothetical protein